MELSPEEKKRIYAEEKERLIAQEKAKKELQDEEAKEGLWTRADTFVRKMSKYKEQDEETKKQIQKVVGVLWGMSLLIIFLAVGSEIKSCQNAPRPSRPQKPAVSETETLFHIAMPGEYWIVQEDVSVLKDTEPIRNKAQFLRQLVGIIPPGTKVEILESKGILSPWKRVYVYNDRNQIYAEGWIKAGAVKKAKRVKEALSP